MAQVEDETAGADDGLEDFWQESWSCGSTFTPTGRLVNAIAEEDWVGFEGDDSVPPFLVANLPPVFFGVVVFVKRPGGWTGIAVENHHRVQGAFVARGQGLANVFTMYSVEGPGHEYRILRTSNGFAEVACSVLEFPGDVPNPQTFLSLADFNGDDGEAFLVGFADIEDENGDSRTRWFRYRMKEGDASWSEPEALPTQPAPLVGIYSAAGGRGLGDLIADLRRTAA